MITLIYYWTTAGAQRLTLYELEEVVPGLDLNLIALVLIAPEIPLL